MTDALLVSYGVLWIVVIALAILVLSLLRLIGALHQRIGPAGAAVIEPGPEIGESVRELLGKKGVDPAAIELPASGEALIVFVSPDCIACDELMPSLVPFARRMRGRTDVVTVDILAEPRIGRALGIDSTPYALWLDAEGRVCAKGVVNHGEHLESLENAGRMGFATLQEYAADNLRRESGSSLTTTRR